MYYSVMHPVFLVHLNSVTSQFSLKFATNGCRMFFFPLFSLKENFGGSLESLSMLKTTFTVFKTSSIVETPTYKEGSADSSSGHMKCVCRKSKFCHRISTNGKQRYLAFLCGLDLNF